MYGDTPQSACYPNVWLNEIRAWEKVLSDAEILADKGRTTPDLTNLVAWYPMSEGTGTLTKDKSGLNKNGTINSATWARR